MAEPTPQPAARLPATITQTIYNYFKNAIIEGQLKPGERLQVKDAAALFGASATPVREAFQRLASEDFIVINARKDVSVAKISMEEIQGLFEIVRVLDALASKKAVLKLSEKEVKELRRMTDRMSKYFRQKKISEYIKENLRIHRALWKHCDNQILARFLVNLGDKYAFYGHYLFTPDGQGGGDSAYFVTSHQDHLELMEAVEKRDPRRVEKILLSHWGHRYPEERR
ncbi:MAG: GntR family transcriptional regulator [Acidobacteriota bacterium]